MNKQTAQEVSKVEALRDWSHPLCHIQAAHADYAARTLTAIHRASGPKVQKEIEQCIERCGLWSSIQKRNGSLIALADA